MQAELVSDKLSSSVGSAARKRVSVAGFGIALVALALMLVAAGFISAGKSGAEKTLIRLIQPIGLSWLCFTAWTTRYTLLNGLRRAIVPWSIWCLVMFFTTSPFASWCVRRLESSVDSYQPERDGPLAAVVVLGGGTRQGPHRAEAGQAGDRVMYAAQLYLHGHTSRLITTGDATPGISRDTTSPRDQTIEIWTKLNIPPDAIGSLHGINTYQELQSLKEVFAQLSGGRVGVLTSALHLPRAMRLAKAAGLEVVPLAANHEASAEPFTYLDFIPSAGPLNQLSACQHEFMAWFVGR